MHGWDQDTPVDETLDTLTGLVRSGHIRHVGWSNVTGWQLQRIVSTARLGGFVVPVALQPQYNLLDRGSEWDLIPCCLEEQLGVTPWSPLGGGWLTGKYRRDERPSGATRLGDDPNRGVEAYDVRNEDRTWRILDAVQAIADRHGRPMSHVALAWLTSRPSVTSVLLGARTTEQLTDNLGAANVVLDDGDLDELSGYRRRACRRIRTAWSRSSATSRTGGPSAPAARCEPSGRSDTGSPKDSAEDHSGLPISDEIGR